MKKVFSFLLLFILSLSMTSCAFSGYPPLKRDKLLGFWGCVTEQIGPSTPVGFVGFEFREDGTGTQFCRNYNGHDRVEDLGGYAADGAHPITYSIRGCKLTIRYLELGEEAQITQDAKVEGNTLEIWFPFEWTGGPTENFDRYNSVVFDGKICTTVDTNGQDTVYTINTTPNELSGSWVNTTDETAQTEAPFFAFTFGNRYEPSDFAEFYSNAPSLPEKQYHTRMTYTLENDILTFTIPVLSAKAKVISTTVSRYRAEVESGEMKLLRIGDQGEPISPCTIDLGLKAGELPIPETMVKVTHTPSIVTEYELIGYWGNFGLSDPPELRAMAFSGDGHGILFFKNYDGLTGQFPMNYRIVRLNHVLVTWHYEGQQIEWDFEFKIDSDRIDEYLADTKGVFPNIAGWLSRLQPLSSVEFSSNGMCIVKELDSNGRIVERQF